MGRDLLGKPLRDLRRSLLGWSAGLGLMTAITASFYPSIRDNEALDAYLESLPEAARGFLGGAGDITSVAGFFQTELFNFLPLILAVFTVGKAAALTVGEEREGTMDLVLAQPVRRWRVFVDRFVALGLAVLAISSVIALVLGLAGVPLDLTSREIAGLVVWPFLAGLLALSFGAVTVAVAGFAQRKGPAIVAGAALAVASFLYDGLAPLSGALSDLRAVSPYRWYAASNPVSGELDVLGIVGLALLTVALVAVGTWAFERKDVGV